MTINPIASRRRAAKIRAGVLILTLSFLWPLQGHAGAILYGITGDGASTPSTLHTLSTTNASATVLAALGNGNDGEALAFNPIDGLLYHASGYGVPNTDQVFETIDPGTLAVNSITLTGDDYNGTLALTFNPTTGGFLLADLGDFTSSNLFDVSVTGVVSLIGAADHLVKGLAFRDGALYSVDVITETLRTLDPLTGTTLTDGLVTLAGAAANENVDSFRGLATNPDTGELWGVAWIAENNARSRQELVAIDQTTLVATSVGTLDDRFAAIAFESSQPVPAPAPATLTLLLTALGLTAFGSGRRGACRRRRA